jgi:hypothetical protein
MHVAALSLIIHMGKSYKPLIFVVIPGNLIAQKNAIGEGHIRESVTAKIHGFPLSTEVKKGVAESSVVNSLLDNGINLAPPLIVQVGV